MEIDRMLIFECDESMNNSFTFDQIKTCYIDPPTMEPFQLFNLIQFLMYDEDLGGSCSIQKNYLYHGDKGTYMYSKVRTLVAK